MNFVARAPQLSSEQKRARLENISEAYDALQRTEEAEPAALSVSLP